MAVVRQSEASSSQAIPTRVASCSASLQQTRPCENHQPLYGQRKRKREPVSSPISPKSTRRKRSKALGAPDVRKVSSINRPAFWGGVAPLSPGVPLWAAVVQLELGDQISASWRPLVLISTRPLDLVPPMGNSIVLDISHRFALDPIEGSACRRAPLVRFRTTDAGSFDALDDDQFDLAIRWTREAMAQHNNDVLPTYLGDLLYVLLPMAPTGQQSGAVDRFEKVMIDWAEMRKLDHGASRPIPRAGSGLPLLDKLRDKVSFDEAKPLRRLLVEGEGYVPQGPKRDSEVRPPAPCGNSSDFRLWSVIANRSGASYLKGDEQLTWETLNHFGSRLRVMFLSTSVYRSTSVIPAISWAIEDALLGLELSQQRLGGIISPGLTADALTLAAAVPGHVERSCERLEILGDSVLHLICEIDAHCSHVTDTTGKASLAGARAHLELLQRNAHLCRLADEAGILPYIRRRPVQKAFRTRAGCTLLGRGKTCSPQEPELSVKVRNTSSLRELEDNSLSLLSPQHS